MTSPLVETFPYEKSKETITCDYCGCVFEITVPGQKGHEGLEEYYCPECKKEFKTRASNTPTIFKLKNRTDGRTNIYSETTNTKKNK